MAGGTRSYDVLLFDLGCSKPFVSNHFSMSSHSLNSVHGIRRNLPSNTSPAIKRDLYQLIGEDTAIRKQLIITAFYEALTLADTARSSRTDRIFKKYFRLQDRAVVNQVFSNILGSNPKIGAPQLGDINVVFGDPKRVCQDRFRSEMAYTEGPPPTITVCDGLWTYTGTTFEHKECYQLGTAVTRAMQSISSVVLHEFTYVSTPRRNGL